MVQLWKFILGAPRLPPVKANIPLALVIRACLRQLLTQPALHDLKLPTPWNREHAASAHASKRQQKVTCASSMSSSLAKTYPMNCCWHLQLQQKASRKMVRCFLFLSLRLQKHSLTPVALHSYAHAALITHHLSIRS